MAEYHGETHSQCFSFLDRKEAETLLAAMDWLDLSAGSTLYHSDQSAGHFYVLVTGRIAVQKPTGFGERMQVVALLDAGAPLGESGLLDGQQRGATLTAVLPCRLLVLSSAAFAALTRSHSDLAVKLLSWVVARISLRLKKSSERLALVL